MSDDNAAILPVIAGAACSAVWGGKIYCCEGKDETCRWREEYAVEIMAAIDAAGYEVVLKQPTLDHKHGGEHDAKGEGACPTTT